MGRLTAAAVKAARHPGTSARPVRLGDGDGLYLQVAAGGTKSWLFRYTLAGKPREMGLGAVALTPEDERAGAVPLVAAREAARAAKQQLRQGTDPIEARRATARAKASAVRPHTFREVSELYVEAHRATWRGAKFQRQWRASLERDAWPRFGEMPVGEVSTADVLGALKPIWHAKPEAASRVRGRVEVVLDYATALGWRTGENPARWRGHLDKLLPAPGKVARTKHRAALPWAEVGAFMAELRRRRAPAARMLELVVLTLARTVEIRAMRWGEVDLTAALWTVPAERMKAEKEHRVPLSTLAVAVLRGLLPPGQATPDPTAVVFPSYRPHRPLSDKAMLALLLRMNPSKEGAPARWRDARTGEPITPHGFRSCFRDWVAEATSYSRELAEAALAHTLGSAVEAAYQRGDMLEKRRRLMEAWGQFCAKPRMAGEVVPIRRPGVRG